MSDAEISAYLLIAGGLVWVLMGIVGLARRRRGSEGNDLEQTLEGQGRAEGEEVDASEECLGELIDLLNSDHPLMRPHVDSIVDPYLVKLGNDNALASLASTTLADLLTLFWRADPDSAIWTSSRT